MTSFVSVSLSDETSLRLEKEMIRVHKIRAVAGFALICFAIMTIAFSAVKKSHIDKHPPEETENGEIYLSNLDEAAFNVLDLAVRRSADRIFEVRMPATLWGRFAREDFIYMRRPKYSEIESKLKARIRNELSAASISPASPEEHLIQRAKRCYDAFWKRDGLLGKDAFLECYEARACIELAISKGGATLEKYRFLSEVVMANNPVYFHDRHNLKYVRELLIPILEKRLHLAEALSDAGKYRIGWGEFEACWDLSSLYGYIKERGKAAQILEWAIANAALGGWEGWLPRNMPTPAPCPLQRRRRPIWRLPLPR